MNDPPKSPQPKTASFVSRWLKEHEHLAGWIEAIGVVVALFFGVIQLRDARIALESAGEANRITLKSQVNDLLLEINHAALDHPELAGEYPGIRRLHLMRLHYFFRVHDLYQQGLFDEERFEAETNYLEWTARQEDFQLVWSDFDEQYPDSFQAWVNEVIASQPRESKSRPSAPR